MKKVVEDLGVGEVLIARERTLHGTNTYKWTVIFLESLGNLPTIRILNERHMCSGTGILSKVFVEESVAGFFPEMNTSSYDFVEVDATSEQMQYKIENLESDTPYIVRVSSWNGVGLTYGQSAYSNPVLITPSSVPTKPTDVHVVPGSHEELHLSINCLHSHKFPTLWYNVEWTSAASYNKATFYPLLELQSIILSGSSSDLGGFFYVHFMGLRTEAISWNASSDQMKEMLEGIPFISKVKVSKEDFKPNLVHKWNITFLDQTGDVPSLLVSTGVSRPTRAAAGGSLTGSAPYLRVIEKRKGGLPPTYVLAENVTNFDKYSIRVQACNGIGCGNFSRRITDVKVSKQVPSKPQNVLMTAVSDDLIKVTWEAPSTDGGHPITKYSIQWGFDYSFTLGTFDLEVQEDQTHFEFATSLVHSSSNYCFRVLAYNSLGYSKDQRAKRSDAFKMMYQVEFSANDTEQDLSTDAFTLNYTTFSGASEISNPINITAGPHHCQSIINSMNLTGPVSVQKSDRSFLGENSTIILFTIGFLIPVEEGTVFSSFQGSNNVSMTMRLVQQPQNNEFLTPFAQPPSVPRSVEVVQVSSTELGLTWITPSFEGGSPIEAYIIEWCTLYNFQGSTLKKDIVVKSESANFERYQILGLFNNASYYVRVTAINKFGYSDAVLAMPSPLQPIGKKLYLPESPTLSLSTSQTSNRLNLHWSLPTRDSNGFSTKPHECAGEVGNTPDEAYAYDIRWSRNPLMESFNSFRVFMFEGDNIRNKCCPPFGCSVEIGTEIQSIILNSTMNTAISAGSFKVIYAGEQTKGVNLLFDTNLTVAKVIMYDGNYEAKVGDYVRISDFISRIIYIEGAFITLEERYNREVSYVPVKGFFNTPPESCFSPTFDGSALSMQMHIAENFDHSPFDESISVSREMFSRSNGFGTIYRITFSGPSFHKATEQLYLSMCTDGFEVDGLPSLSASVIIRTEMESGSIIAGEPTYVQIGAVNKHGTGEFAITQPYSIIPMSLPGLAQNCRVYAVPSTPSSLKVEWDGVTSLHGSIIYKFIIQLFAGGELVTTYEVDAEEESSKYSLHCDGLSPGSLYEVVVLPVSTLGEGNFVFRYSCID